MGAGLYLYHGTSERCVRGILDRGIIPRSESKITANPTKFGSMSDAVYLTEAHPLYYACRASQMHERWAIIEIDTTRIDPDALWMVPDEYFLEEVTRDSDISNLEGFEEAVTPNQRLAQFRRSIHNFAHLWKSSVDGIGGCAHLGPIPVEAITTLVLIDPSDHPYMCGLGMKPDISVSGYAVSQVKHRALTRWAAGYQAKASDINDGVQQPVVWLHDDRNVIAVEDWRDRQKMILDGMSNRNGFEFIIGEPKNSL